MAEVEAALAAGRLPILVGGTGLYLRSFAEGLSAVPEVPPEVRRTARAEMMTLGAAAFHDRLAEHDPVMAARLAPGDRQSLLRAWEVFTANGRSPADWLAAPGTTSSQRAAKLRPLYTHPLVYAACNHHE